MDVRKKSMRACLLLLALCSGFWTACYKDKGNYDYDMPETPVVSNLDTLYNAIVGDSLIIAPTVTMQSPHELELQWHIGSAQLPEGLDYTGPSLRLLFGLQANRYLGRLTVYDKTNGMKYFHTFQIQGVTEFTAGTTVLSVEDGVSRLSFIKPDGTVQANIYEAINGKQLPPEPLNVFYMQNEQAGGTPLGYWILFRDGGVRLNGNTMQDEPTYPNTLAANFFSAPETLEVGSLKNHMQGVLMGVINGKFYGGTTSTWDQSPTYGMFGDFAAGDYELAPSFVMSTANNNTIFVAYEKNKKQFVRINLYGAPSYFGTQYTSTNADIFDPVNVGMDLLHMEQINNGDCFAYCKDPDGTIYELKFTVNFLGPFTFTPVYKRTFARPDLITGETRWQAARNGAIYLGVGSKIYRYNPLNQEFRALDTSFDGPVTMLRIADDEQALIAGAGNSIYYLDITTGRYGPTVKKIDGIPGNPVDIAWRPSAIN